MDWINLFLQFGYIGVFLISFLGSVSVVIPIPYAISFYVMGSTHDPLLIAIAGGLGSGLGEIAGYVLGYFGHRFISEDQKRRMFYLLKIFDRYGPVIIFLFALTPLPDDMLFIPLGISRFNLPKVLIPCIIGKVVMAYIVAYSGKISFQLIKAVFGESGLLTAVITIILSIIIIFSILRIDWEKIFSKYVEKK